MRAFLTVLMMMGLFGSMAHAAGDLTVFRAYQATMQAVRNSENISSDSVLKGIRASAQKCTDTIDAALKAGAAPTDPVPNTKLTVSQARVACVSAVKKVATSWIGLRAAYFATWAVNVKKPGRTEVDGAQAVREAATCRAEVDDALAAGVPQTAQITMKDAEPITLAGVKARVCDAVAAAGQGIVDAEKARQDAKKAPFLKVLTGDKKVIFERLWGDAFYAAGGAQLFTPEDLQGAHAWFTVLTWVDPNDGYTHWTVRKYTFDGDQMRGTASEHSGCCDDPASDEYR